MYAPLDKPPIDEMYHFGIKGMKWGHRPSDPDPTDASHHPVKKQTKMSEKQRFKKDTTIGELPEKYNQTAKVNKDGSRTLPKGFRFYRVGGSNLDINKEKNTIYVSNAATDDVYRYIKAVGPSTFGRILNTAHYNIQTIKATNSISVASKKKTREMVTEYLSKNPEINTLFLLSFWGMGVTKDSDDVMKSKLFFGYLATPESVGSKEFYKYVKNKGYDAVPDMMDLGTPKIGAAAEDPIIILNTNKIKLESSNFINKDVYKKGKKYVKDKKLEDLKWQE